MAATNQGLVTGPLSEPTLKAAGWEACRDLQEPLRFLGDRVIEGWGHQGVDLGSHYRPSYG